MLPIIAAALAAAAVAGKLVYDAVTEEKPSKSRSASSTASEATRTEQEQALERQRRSRLDTLRHEAREHARQEVHALLEAHSAVVSGNVNRWITMDALRKVADAAQGDGNLLDILEPLTVGLKYTREHKAEGRQIEALKAQADELSDFIKHL